MKKDETYTMRNIKNKVEDVASKYHILMDELNALNDPESLKEMEDTLEELETLSRDIRLQYEQALKEEHNERQISEIEKNIFNSIRSFDKAYTKAGSIFHTH